MSQDQFTNVCVTVFEKKKMSSELATVWKFFKIILLMRYACLHVILFVNLKNSVRFLKYVILFLVFEHLFFAARMKRNRQGSRRARHLVKA